MCNSCCRSGAWLRTSALFAGDRNTIRKLLTSKSKQFTDAVLSRPLDGRQPLEVVGTSKVRNQLRVHVKDPNEHDQRTFFVLVKEDGRVLVDLVATTAYNSEHHRLPGPREIVRQKRLTPREIERIRAVTKQAIR
jgi:hypothetical protein